jgi:uncharacterized membrane protein YgdD (TMEM256/DUF423 family)
MKILNESSEGMAGKRIAIGSWLAALAVIAGAFGAHALKHVLNERYMHAYQTAVTYHLFHSLAIILCGILHASLHAQRIRMAYRFFLAGLILFSGSLYVLSVFAGNGYDSFSRVGVITPFGGLCFISGWVMIAAATQKSS